MVLDAFPPQPLPSPVTLKQMIAGYSCESGGLRWRSVFAHLWFWGPSPGDRPPHAAAGAAATLGLCSSSPLRTARPERLSAAALLPQTLAAAARLCPAPHSGDEPTRGILRVGSAQPAAAPLPRQGPGRRRPDARSFTLIRLLLARLRWEPRTPHSVSSSPPPPHGGSPRGQGPAEVTRRPRRGQESGRPG